MIEQIMERAFFHLAAGAGAYLAAVFAFEWAKRRWVHFFAYWWPRILPGLLAVFLVAVRDVKFFTDRAAWIAGVVLAVWALYRWERRVR